MASKVNTGSGLILLFILMLTRNSAETREIKRPASNFVAHSIVQPVVHHGRTKRELSSTRDISGMHHSEIQLMVPVNGEQYFLDLQLNKNLLTREHTLQYQKKGQTVQKKPEIEDLDFCYYTGSVRGKPDSLVAVSTCHGVRGVIHEGQTMRYIEPVRGHEIQSSHYLYEDFNTNSVRHHRYDYDNHDVSDLLNKSYQKNIKESQAVRHKRGTSEQIHLPYNENNESRYIELAIVVDNAEFCTNKKSIPTVLSKVYQLANIVNTLLSQLNIYVALVGVELWNNFDKIEVDNNSSITLHRFVKYRREKLALEIPNDVAFLLSKKQFDENVLGKSYQSAICLDPFSGGIATTHKTKSGNLAKIIAHELGHLLGLNHDSEDCECPEGSCIMSESFDIDIPLPVHWSACSYSYRANTTIIGLDYCLRNKPTTRFCGNGFVEPGEQCDCGTDVDIGGINLCHACCHADTCTLRSNATCGAGACCDFTTCNLKPAGVSCRTADKECDLPEFCTGSSEFCPADVYRMDSTPCGKGNNAAYCVHGECRSHTNQCRYLWGDSTAESSDLKCYDRNTEGTHYGNCGFDQANYKSIPCPAGDILCGIQQCRSKNIQFLKSDPGYRYIINNMNITSNGSTVPCHTVTQRHELDVVDPGLVSDGAKCGYERMCLNQKCVSIKSVREVIRNSETSVCPSDCSGHGVCNSKGHCHCDEGFAPPLCTESGSGGSVDSGPPGLFEQSRSL